jgi:hypothetical protein
MLYLEKSGNPGEKSGNPGENNSSSEILGVMSTAYNSKVCQFPQKLFCSLFLLNDRDHCLDICRACGVTTTDDGLQFSKANFVGGKVEKNYEMVFYRICIPI